MAQVQVRSGRELDREEHPQEGTPESGKVGRVRQEWAVFEDGALAHRLQEDEFDHHYGFNRKNRRTIRDDIQVAKVVQTEEEMIQQRERMRELEIHRQRSIQDEQIARQVMDQLAAEEREIQRQKELDDETAALQLHIAEEEDILRQQELDNEARARKDHMEARFVQMREVEDYRKKKEDDERKARQLLVSLAAEETAEQMEQEIIDEGLARRLQEKEQRKFEKYQEKKKAKALARERRRLEEQLAQESEEAISTPGRLREDGKTEDTGDFSDFYIPPAPGMNEDESKQLQELQDEELARLLQDQEHKRGGSVVNKDKLKQIEQQDAELARIIQEQERMKLKKAREKHRQQSMQQRHVQEEVHLPTRSQSMPHSRPMVPTPDGTACSDIPPRPTSHLDSSPPPRPERTDKIGSQSHMPRTKPPDLPPPPVPAGEQPRWEAEAEIALQTQRAARDLNDSLERALNKSHDSDSESEFPANGYPSHNTYTHQEGRISHRHASSGSDPPSDTEVGSFNIATAIDPTYRRQGGPRPEQTPSPLKQPATSLEENTLKNRRMVAPTDPQPTQAREQRILTEQQGASGAFEDGYCDFDNGDPSFSPVPGHKRSPGTEKQKKGKDKSGKKNNCKQQ